jgi:transcription elongation factor Elf1
VEQLQLDFDELKCKMCGKNTSGLVRVSLYGFDGLMVCKACQDRLFEKRNLLYSKIVEEYCLKVYGYYYNRKIAKLRYQEEKEEKMSKTSIHYFRCPVCGSVKFRKRGKPRDKMYQCTACGAIRYKGRRKRKKGGEMLKHKLVTALVVALTLTFVTGAKAVETIPVKWESEWSSKKAGKLPYFAKLQNKNGKLDRSFVNGTWEYKNDRNDNRKLVIDTELPEGMYIEARVEKTTRKDDRRYYEVLEEGLVETTRELVEVALGIGK